MLQPAAVPDTSLPLHGEAATQAVAARIAAALRPGDTVLLDGPVGAGKSAFARAAIQALQAGAGQTPEAVPSPSFTLVQEYRAGGTAIWHADLYRLSDPDELAELGLDDAFETAIVFVEWPALLGGATPVRHMRVTLTPDAADADLRHAGFDFAGPGWDRVRAALA